MSDMTSRAHTEGALQQIVGMRDFKEWRSMDTAPRDGTWVELKCTYGVAPWYCIARWTDEKISHCVESYRDPETGEHRQRDLGLRTFKADKPSWVQPEGGGPFDEESLHWRPYQGEPSSYIDPTAGLQNDMGYWRAAVASKYGLPLDHFEAKASSQPAPWWAFWRQK